MKLFLDTANLKDIEEALHAGFIRGITTNPSLLSKEPRGNYLEHMRKIVELCKQYGGTASLSIEVFTNDKREMVAQAREFVKALRYKHLAVKIPIGYKGENNLSVMRELSESGITVNATACMTALQLASSAASGAKYVSLFYNRLRDAAGEEKYEKERREFLEKKIVGAGDFDPLVVLREARPLLLAYPDAEIIVGSIRNPVDVKEAALAGGHIVTASFKILSDAFQHFKTDDSIERFLQDFAGWIG